MPELTVLSPSRLRSSRRKLSSVNGYNTTPIQNFWGIELTDEAPECEWNMKEEADEEFGSDRDYMMNHLLVKQATLGQGVAKNEEHVVEVETMDMYHKVIKIPVVNMESGVHNTIPLDLEFSDKCKVTFRLVAGPGPIYLSGCCTQEHPEDEVDSQENSLYTEPETTATDENGDSEEMDEEDEEDVEEEEEEVTIKKGTKRKTVSPSVKTKSKQRSKIEESEEEDSEDEDDDDEEEEMDIGKKKKGKPIASPKPSKSPRAKLGKKSPELKDKKKAKKGKGK